ncbi:MAG: NUDIX hydrolase [bacterium]
MFSIGLFAIIVDGKGKVLLCHRTEHNFWALPGGGLEKGETPWEGVIREVKEETGLNVEVERLIDVSSKPHEDNVGFTFLCKVSGGEIIPDDFVDTVKFFSLECFPKNTSPRHVERINGFFKNVDKKDVALRSQRGKSAYQLAEDGTL